MNQHVAAICLLVLGVLVIACIIGAARLPHPGSDVQEPPQPDDAPNAADQVSADRPLLIFPEFLTEWEDEWHLRIGPWGMQAVCICGHKLAVKNDREVPGVCRACGRHRDWTFQVEREEYESDRGVVKCVSNPQNWNNGYLRNWGGVGSKRERTRNHRVVVWTPEGSREPRTY